MESYVVSKFLQTSPIEKFSKLRYPCVVPISPSESSVSSQELSISESSLSGHASEDVSGYVHEKTQASTPSYVSDPVLDQASDTQKRANEAACDEDANNKHSLEISNRIIIPPHQEQTIVELLPTINHEILQEQPETKDHNDEETRAQARFMKHTSESTLFEQTQQHYTSSAIDAREEDIPTPLLFPTTQLPLKPRVIDTDGSLHKRARRKILAHKHSMQAFQVCINGFPIFATWWWPKYFYIFLPFITITVAINIVMIFSLIFRVLRNKIVPEKIIMPEHPESMVFLVPCYNETKEELYKSLESLVRQTKIDDHKHAIMIVCDGKFRGPGMAKTTADYLLQEILIDWTERKYIPSAYTAWDQQPMDIVVQRGKYQGVPYYCIIKQQNQGKRDGLIVARSFLYNFNRRSDCPHTIFLPEFFEDMCSYLSQDANMDSCEHIIGMDADTVFADDCVYEMLQESRYPHTVGVCGYVAVDYKDSSFNIWRLYQNAEYTIAQCLRRLHQSMVTHKVSCLPGCCQLLKVCEETCGDHVLLELFGYCPVESDGLLKQIQATASEDRNHVCHMLSARPNAQTRQALKAKAFTDVPSSASVFLSQRRRWTLGATSNDLLLSFAPGVQWFERILALVNVITWLLNPFIIASLASFIYACLFVKTWIIMCFVSVMLVPIVYYVFIPLWFTSAWKIRVQFWAGLIFFVCCGPFINISVLLYASFYMDSFGWGKTRKVVTEVDCGEETETELQRLEKGDRAVQDKIPTRSFAEV
ncbi:Nn.00g061330.m01.CDS01 [Neocucurbitaria sp. VM-36]